MVCKEREYPEKLIDSEIRKAKFNTRETNRKNKSKNGVPVVSLLYIDQMVKEVQRDLVWSRFSEKRLKKKKCPVY